MHWIIRKINSLVGTPRVWVSLAIALAAFGCTQLSGMYYLTGLTLAWDVFATTLIALSAVTFFTLPQEALRQQAQIQDERRTITFILVLLSIGVSFTGILLLLHSPGKTLPNASMHRALSLIGIALSWLLHTIFTLRYAHLYYNEQDENIEPGGLLFPGNEPPDYLDFVYFSFIIGMTFQVSDVSIASRHIRRVTLLHSLLSFAFNTVIVALTISILSSIV